MSKGKNGSTFTIVGILSVIGIITGIVANISDIKRNKNESNSANNAATAATQATTVNRSDSDTQISQNDSPAPEVPQDNFNFTSGDLIDMCSPYQTECYEEWTNLSIAGKIYPTGISIGGTATHRSDGYALYNLSGKYQSLSFDVGNIDDRGVATGQMLYIYLDNRLVWQLELEPEGLPTHHTIELTGAQQMKITGSEWAGDYGIFNLWIEENGSNSENKPPQASLQNSQNDFEFSSGDLIDICSPYKENCYEEWKNLAVAGKKYATGISIGGTATHRSDGYALYNLSGKFKSLSFDVGNIDDRGVAKDQTLCIYLDNQLVWQFELEPEGLPTHHEIDLTDAQQMKITGSEWAGDYGMFNLWIEKNDN